MANESKYIPLFGTELEKSVNGFILRFLILFYYLVFLLVGATSLNEYIQYEYEKALPYGLAFAFFWSWGYWLIVYIVARLLIWLFTGSNR